jgi:hypothetical protein
MFLPRDFALRLEVIGLAAARCAVLKMVNLVLHGKVG